MTTTKKQRIQRQAGAVRTNNRKKGINTLTDDDSKTRLHVVNKNVYTTVNAVNNNDEEGETQDLIIGVRWVSPATPSKQARCMI